MPASPDIRLKAAIDLARSEQKPLDLRQLTPFPNGRTLQDSVICQDLFKNVLIPDSAFQRLIENGYPSALLSLAIVGFSRLQMLDLTIARRLKANAGDFKIAEEDFLDIESSIDELDISAATVTPETITFLQQTPRVKKVLLSLAQAKANPAVLSNSKFFVTGAIPSLTSIDRFYDDVTFTNCDLNVTQLIFSLRYPPKPNATKVALDVAELVRAYNLKFRKNKTIFDILSMRDAAEIKQRQLFLEDYCFREAIKKKVPFTFDDAKYFSESKLYAKHNFAGIVVLNENGMFDLLQDKETAKLPNPKVAPSVLRDIWHEIKQAEVKVKKTHAAGNVITEAEFLLAIGRKNFFFRGLTVTGDVDLSQLSNKDLTELDLGNVTFQGKFNASGCKLTGVNCQGAKFEQDVIFDGADIRDVNFKDAQFKADFHVDQKTNVGKRTGPFDSTYKTNARTQLERTTFKFSSATPVPEIGFEHKDSISVSVAKQKLPDREDNPQVSLLWKAFTKQYQSICNEEKVFKHFRGNIIDRLNKKQLSDAEKINELVRHAQREPGGRTDRALRLVLPSFIPVSNSVARDDRNAQPIFAHQVQASDESRTPSPATIGTALHQQVSPRLGPPQVSDVLGSPQSVSDKLKFFFDEANGTFTLSADRALQLSDTFSVAVRNYIVAPADQKTSAMNATLSTLERRARAILSSLDVVASFSEPASLDTTALESDYQKKQKEMVALYLLLKASKPAAAEVTAFEQKRDAAVVLLQQVLAAPQNFLEAREEILSALQFVRMVNGDNDEVLTAFADAVETSKDKANTIMALFDNAKLCDSTDKQLQTMQYFFVQRKYLLQVLGADKKLLDRIEAAKRILHSALSDFKKSTYLFGNKDNSSNPETAKNKVVSAYLFLKAAGETDAVARYDTLLRDHIYPHYLRFALRPKTERSDASGTPKFRYNLAEELFIRSGMIDAANRLAVAGSQRAQVSGGAGLFARKDFSAKDAFENDCLKRWANLPLSFLKQGGFVDPAIFDAVQTKMAAQQVSVRDQDRLCLERIFYLEELIKFEKFDDAIREAKAIKAAGYAEQLNVSPDQINLAQLLDTTLSTVVGEIKTRIVAESKHMLAVHLPDPGYVLGKDSNHLLNKSDALCRVRGEALEEILTVIHGQCAPMRSDIKDMRSVITHGATNTYALKTIAESVLQGNSFDHSLLLALDPKIENGGHNDSRVVWVGKAGEKQALLQRLLEATEEEKARIEAGEGNLSRKDLLVGLCECIFRMKPIDGLLKVPLKKDDIPSKLEHKDVELMNRGAIGLQYVTQLLERAFAPLWEYPPIQGAITRPNGVLTFADPNDVATKALITEPYQFLGTSEINFLKYKKVVALYGELQKTCDVLRSIEITRGVDYHRAINDAVRGLMTKIEAVKVDIASHNVLKDEVGKTFDKLIYNEKEGTGILAAVRDAHMKWMEYCAGMNSDANLSQHRKSRQRQLPSV